MKYGIRECANIVFRAKQETTIGTAKFHIGQPVLYIDTATTSSMEQASTSVYAQGGRGNARLIAWEGDKTLTFTVTDALISPISLSMLSGAGLVKESGKKVHVHATTAATMIYTAAVAEEGTTPASPATATIDLSEALLSFGQKISATATGADGGVAIDAGTDAPLFIIHTEDDGSVTGDIVTGSTIEYVAIKEGEGTSEKVVGAKLVITDPKWNGTDAIEENENVLVDYYVIKDSAKVSEIQITANDFAGYYYVEADTLFRSQADGTDMPANLTFPNVKVQSGFTIAMSGTGDPSTFDFTMDAFPGYTYFDKTKKVLCVIQVVEDSASSAATSRSVMTVSDAVEHEDPLKGDSDLGEYNY